MTGSKVHAAVLADRLYIAAMNGVDPLRIALTALAMATIASAVPDAELISAWNATLASEGDRVKIARDLWEMAAREAPYLRETINPLVDWLDVADEKDSEALGACFDVLSALDFAGTVAFNDGEILGPVYEYLLTPEERERVQAYFPPMTACFMTAYMHQAQYGALMIDEACGAGVMAVAHVREFLSRGGSADTLGFLLADPDPIAVALAGVNMAALGMEQVHLHCGDGLFDRPEWAEGKPEQTVSKHGRKKAKA